MQNPPLIPPHPLTPRRNLGVVQQRAVQLSLAAQQNLAVNPAQQQVQQMPAVPVPHPHQVPAVALAQPQQVPVVPVAQALQMPAVPLV